MRRKNCLALAAIAAMACSSIAYAQSDLPIHSKKLANGLEVIVIENHAVPIVTVELDVKNGSYTESPEFNGLSHLYEHMFFKANRAIPSQEAYLRRTNQLGAVWNGTTSEERVNYYVTVGKDSLVPAMQFMEDAIRYPLFDQNELVRERPVVLGEFDRNEANPVFHLLRGADTLLLDARLLLAEKRDWKPPDDCHGDTGKDECDQESLLRSEQCGADTFG